jgi:creatinine amidohydrolase
VPRRWAELTWEEVRDLEPSRSQMVALLPVGAIEAHGPHLPLATDVLIAEAMAEAAAERLESGGLSAVLLPSFPYAAAPFGGAFPGTLSVAAESVTRLLVDIARELTRHGFAALAIANAHLDPAHLESLAAARASAEAERLLPVIGPDLTRKQWALRLTEEFQSGACHAGRYEGSVVLAVRPDLVRESIQGGLPPNDVSLSRAIRSGARTFEEAGGPRAYFGRPADATAAEGKRTIATLGAILAEAVREQLASEGRRG